MVEAYNTIQYCTIPPPPRADEYQTRMTPLRPLRMAKSTVLWVCSPFLFPDIMYKVTIKEATQLQKRVIYI